MKECCMCGDYGLASELFQCNSCQFRSQHRYCSNLYPKAETYEICNWCLKKQEEEITNEKAQNSSNSSSSFKTNSVGDDGMNNRKKIKGFRGTLRLQVNTPVKKLRSPETSPSSSRKRIITYRALEEKLRRTKSEEISNKKHSFVRNKVRRYKLLDEVSSQ